MAENQPTLFDTKAPTGYACFKPSRKAPDKIRTGTYAGYRAHQEANETPCVECATAGKVNKSKYGKTHYTKNRDKILARTIKYNHDNQERVADNSRIRYVEDRDRILKVREKYRNANRSKILEYNKFYAQLNPDKLKANGMRRRARKRSLPVDMHTMEDIAKAHGTVCYLCETEVDTTLPNGLPTSPHVDHVHPISREGCPGDVLSNVRWTHAKCNIAKGPKLVSELELPFTAPD